MLVVSDNPAMSRFEMPSGDAIAFVEYRRAGDRIVLTHTEVPEALSGQGVGSKLVAGVLDQIRSEGHPFQGVWSRSFFGLRLQVNTEAVSCEFLSSSVSRNAPRRA